MPSSALAAVEELRRWGRPVVTTSEVAKRLGLSLSAASHLLRSLEEEHAAQRIQRGRWLMQPENPRAAAPYLALPHQAYLTGFWALAHHDMIDQVPRSTELATTARSRTVRLGDSVFELRHLEPRLFDGWSLEGDLPIATPEKALFDTVYFRTSRGVRRVRLPEVELPDGFGADVVQHWLGEIVSARVRSATSDSLAHVMAHAETRNSSRRAGGMHLSC